MHALQWTASSAAKHGVQHGQLCCKHQALVCNGLICPCDNSAASTHCREGKNVRLAVETIVHELGHNYVTGKVVAFTGDCMQY